MCKKVRVSASKKVETDRAHYYVCYVEVKAGHESDLNYACFYSTDFTPREKVCLVENRLKSALEKCDDSRRSMENARYSLRGDGQPNDIGKKHVA